MAATAAPAEIQQVTVIDSYEQQTVSTLWSATSSLSLLPFCHFSPDLCVAFRDRTGQLCFDAE